MSGEPAMGQALRLLRERAGVAQRELAQRARTSAGMVSSYELGKSDPGAGTLERLLSAMGYSFRDLDIALRQVRGKEIPSKPTNGTPAPDLEGLTRDAWATRHTQDLVSREVDRRVARIMREILGHDPRALAGEDRQGEPARGQG